jgi:hypothetical protein
LLRQASITDTLERAESDLTAAHFFDGCGEPGKSSFLSRGRCGFSGFLSKPWTMRGRFAARSIDPIARLARSSAEVPVYGIKKVLQS